MLQSADGTGLLLSSQCIAHEQALAATAAREVELRPRLQKTPQEPAVLEGQRRTHLNPRLRGDDEGGRRCLSFQRYSTSMYLGRARGRRFHAAGSRGDARWKTSKQLLV